MIFFCVYWTNDFQKQIRQYIILSPSTYDFSFFVFDLYVGYSKFYSITKEKSFGSFDIHVTLFY